jgi:hypothetical protein
MLPRMSPLLSLSVVFSLLSLSQCASTTTSSASTIYPKISSTTPGNAVGVSPVLLSFSLEGDAWPQWAANPPSYTSRNQFFYNALNNFHARTGSWPNIRVGANSADRTAFDAKVKVSSFGICRNILLTKSQIIEETYPPPTSSLPYPEVS